MKAGSTTTNLEVEKSEDDSATGYSHGIVLLNIQAFYEGTFTYEYAHTGGGYTDELGTVKYKLEVLGESTKTSQVNLVFYLKFRKHTMSMFSLLVKHTHGAFSHLKLLWQ